MRLRNNKDLSAVDNTPLIKVCPQEDSEINENLNFNNIGKN
jgi:hypothetical protein